MNRSLIGFTLPICLAFSGLVVGQEAEAPKATTEVVEAARAAERDAQRAELAEARAVVAMRRAEERERGTAASRAAAAEAYEKALRTAEVEQRAALEAVEKARREMQTLASTEFQQQREEAARQQDQKLHEQHEMREVQRQLERAHENLRRASREVARVHRQIDRPAVVLAPNSEFAFASDDRAVIGVILGGDNADGVKVLGVSPDGPAERAGMQQGDVIVALMGEPVVVDGKGSTRLLEGVLKDIEPGDELSVTVKRDGEEHDLVVVAEKREPFTWHSFSRIASAPGQAGAPMRIEVPDIDLEALDEEMARLSEELEKTRIVIGDDRIFRFSHGQGEFDIEFEDISEFGDGVIGGTNVWFGMALTRGLKMTELDEGLGDYFNTDRGVLVLKARDDNQLQLESGDVILAVGGSEVSKPADVMRALRGIESGETVDIDIKRKKRSKTLSVVMPERELGYDRGQFPGFRYAVRVKEPVHEEHPPSQD